MSVLPLLPVQLPARAGPTRLYHLPPIAVGTAAVESLTGYVTRLAEAHHLTTSALASSIVVPTATSLGSGPTLSSTWFGRAGSRWNGTGDEAVTASQALTVLTGWRDLTLLTLRPWATHVAAYGLLRREKAVRAWCVACYQERLAHGVPLYEHLLWSLALVTACPHHRIRLQTCCPYPDCARSGPLIAARSRPGYCSWCRRALCLEHATPTAATAQELWVADQLGGLLVASPALARTGRRAGVTLEALVRAVCGVDLGAYGRFAQMVDVHVNLLCHWRKERTLPTIQMLLRISAQLDMPLAALVLGDTRARAHYPSSRRTWAPRRQLRRPRTVADPAPLRLAILAVLAAEPAAPPSLAAVARQVGCTSGQLLRLFPDLCRSIVDGYAMFRTHQRDARRQQLTDDIRREMIRCAALGLYPAPKRVRAQLTHRVHPRNADFVSIHHQILAELGWAVGGMRLVSSPPERLCSAPLH